MFVYTAKIDNGQGGERTIHTARSTPEAMNIAEEWARAGDYSKGIERLKADPLAWDGKVALSLQREGSKLVTSWSFNVLGDK